MMFGNTKRANPLDMMNAQPVDAMGAMQPGQGVPMQAPAQHGKHDGLRRAAGIFADFLAGMNGQQGQYLPMLERQKAAEREAAQYQQHRADAYADWQKQQEWEMEHKPTEAYRTEDNAGNVWQMDPATGQFKPIFIDPNPKQFVQDGQLVTVPNRVREGQGSATPAPAAIDHLRKNPQLKADFDAKYGPGSADRYLGGGGVSNGTSGFPY